MKCLLIDNYIKEFVAVGEFLRRSSAETDEIWVGKRHIIVKRELLTDLLNKNKYDTANNKLKIWKALHWLDAEEKRLTKRVYIPETQRYEARIKIDTGVLQELKKYAK